MNAGIAFIVSFVVGLALVPLALKISRVFGLFAVVKECEAQVFTLFGKVLGTLDKPGLHMPLTIFGPSSASATRSVPRCGSTTCARKW